MARTPSPPFRRAAVAMCPDTFSEKIGVVKPPPLSHSILVHLHTRGNRIKNCFPPPFSNYPRGNLLGYDDDFFHSNDSTPRLGVFRWSKKKEGVKRRGFFNALSMQSRRCTRRETWTFLEKRKGEEAREVRSSRICTMNKTRLLLLSGVSLLPARYV